MKKVILVFLSILTLFGCTKNEAIISPSESASLNALTFLNMSVETISKIQVVRYSDDGQNIYMKEISGQEELSSALDKLNGCTSGEEAEDLQAGGWKIMVRVFDKNGNFVFSAAEQDSGSFTVSDGSCYKSNCDFGDLLEKIYASSEAAEQDYKSAVLSK